MASHLFWFYDALVLGIALIFLYVGSKRGFMRSAVLVVLTVASIALSWLICEVATPIIYENLIKAPVADSLSEASDKTDPVSVVSKAVSGGNYGVEMTDDEVSGVIERTGDFFKNIAGEIKGNGAGESEEAIAGNMEESVTQSMLKALVGDVVSPATLSEILDNVADAEQSARSVVDVFLNGDRAATAEAAESILVAPAVKAVLKGIIWIVSMFILMFISRAIANAFKGLNKVPIIGPVNVLLGAILGLAEGAVVIYLIAQTVRFVCYFTSDSLMFLNTDTVMNTYIFRHLFYFDIMALIG